MKSGTKQPIRKHPMNPNVHGRGVKGQLNGYNYYPPAGFKKPGKGVANMGHD